MGRGYFLARMVVPGTKPVENPWFNEGAVVGLQHPQILQPLLWTLGKIHLAETLEMVSGEGLVFPCHRSFCTAESHFTHPKPPDLSSWRSVTPCQWFLHFSDFRLLIQCVGVKTSGVTFVSVHVFCLFTHLYIWSIHDCHQYIILSN